MAIAISVNDLHFRYKNAQMRRLFRPMPQSKEILKGISFEVEKGEILGVVGSNGSGKSTMLRVLAGLMSPDSGTIDLHGNTISLLALGVGFYNDLSGKDNIYLSGILMGYSKEEIDKKYKDIANFSELGEYLDQPVRTYSSGMRSKLNFSIAVNLKTDIMLIDEVFSVGDMNFRAKSTAVMEEMINEDDLTVIMVSHNLGEIKRLCKRAMWLEEGELKAFGDAVDVLDLYHESMADNSANVLELDIPRIRVTSGEKSVHLSWDAVEHATDYRVYRRENYRGARWVQIADRYEGLEIDDVPPSDKVDYLYAARARMSNGRRDIWSEYRPAGPGRIGSK